MKKVIIDGVEYTAENSGDIKIVILQRGWVFIGKFERNGNDCKLTNASNIRKWGTTKGLGELAMGKTEDTVLDKCNGTVEFDYLTVVATLSVNQEVWKNEL